ncbi:MAG TPA: MarR family transcriptional regulator, partial [Acidimicrobiales bacterium]|nr:MarR family transcriptional regulator [Acidimicrobiales bacterium]
MTSGGSAVRGDPTEAEHANRTIEELEHALFAVARTILRFGIPAHVLRAGESVDRAGYWMLTRLADSDAAMRMSDLAGLLELDPSTVSRQARQLVDAGLVTRVPDPVDRRACLVSLSARGRDVLEAVRDARYDALRHALGAWPETDRAVLAGSLTRLAQDLQAPVRGSAG